LISNNGFSDLKERMGEGRKRRRGELISLASLFRIPYHYN
jgi:hypothetical protein